MEGEGGEGGGEAKRARREGATVEGGGEEAEHDSKRVKKEGAGGGGGGGKGAADEGEGELDTAGANRGTLIQTPAELETKLLTAMKDGYRIEVIHSTVLSSATLGSAQLTPPHHTPTPTPKVHAIGDAAAEAAIDAMQAAVTLAEKAKAEGTALEGLLGAPPETWRPVLTHCQVLGPDLIARMAKLGVVADVQPSFVPTDARFVFERINASIHPWSYAWRTMMAEGVHVAGGSDAPVEPPRPFLGM